MIAVKNCPLINCHYFHLACTFNQSEVTEDLALNAAIQEVAEQESSVPRSPEMSPRRSPPTVEITESEPPTGEAFDFEDDKPVETGITEDVEKPSDDADGEVTAPEEEQVEDEEIAESVTEIEEIFQVSEDGVTWKTVKKITTITPRGQTEKIIILGGIFIVHQSGFVCHFHMYCYLGSYVLLLTLGINRDARFIVELFQFYSQSNIFS